MNGKGDKRRPEDRAKIDANWDRIFKSGSKNAYVPEDKPFTCVDMFKPIGEESVGDSDE